MTKEIKREAVCVYVAMSDRLVLFPHNGATAMIWDMENDRSLGLLGGHTSRIGKAFLHNVENMVVTAAMPDNNANDVYPFKIWSLETMQCTANLTATSLAAGLLKDRLLLGSSSGPIKLWGVGGSTPVALMDLEGHSDAIYQSIDASDTSNAAISGSSDKSVRLWDLRTGQCVRVMEGHANDVYSVSMDSAFKTAVSGSSDKMVKLWDLGSGRCIETYDHDQSICDVMMHESGSAFLVSDLKGKLKAWALGTNKPLLDADLSSLDPSKDVLMRSAASRDLSKVATFYITSTRYLLSVWR